MLGQGLAFSEIKDLTERLLTKMLHAEGVTGGPGHRSELVWVGALGHLGLLNYFPDFGKQIQNSRCHLGPAWAPQVSSLPDNPTTAMKMQ